jgi:hypothetical protein
MRGAATASKQDRSGWLASPRANERRHEQAVRVVAAHQRVLAGCARCRPAGSGDAEAAEDRLDEDGR